MKKLFKAMSLILCVVAAFFALTACADPGAPDHATASPNYAVSQTALTNELDAFMELMHGDRTDFTEYEKDAALYLNNRLLDIGYTDVGLQEFEVSEGDQTHLKSQNVVAHLRADRTTSTKSVIIGAYYSNRYSQAYDGAGYYRSPGALAGGTGVATVLAIADYVKQHESGIDSDLDVTFVFFGASYVARYGATEYINNMTATEYRNTVLMVELQRLGGDHIYAFSDARETKREGFFDGIAAENGLDIYKVTQKSPIINGVTVLNGVPYYQWIHNGVFSEFFNNGIPTLNVMGANWETSSFIDLESSKNDNLSYTVNDTLENLKKYYPDYADKMATAATLLVRSLYSNDFLPTMLADRNNFPDTDVLTQEWIWYLIVFGIIIIAAAVMIALSSYIKKKHPIVIEQPQKVKMAVFGMDYEDRSSGDIYIDIRSGDDGGDEIFPGVQNNTRKPDMGDIFTAVRHIAPIDTADDPFGNNDAAPHVVGGKDGETDNDVAETAEKSRDDNSGGGDEQDNTDPFGLPPDNGGANASNKAKPKKPRAKKPKSTTPPNDDSRE